MMPPERLEQYKTIFKEILQRLAADLRKYQTNRAAENASILDHAGRLAELSQRLNVVRGTACVELIIACHEKYSKLFMTNMGLSQQLSALSTHKEDFDAQYQSFLDELEQEDPKVPKSLREFSDWINNVLDALYNHDKFLELSLNQMQTPAYVQRQEFLDEFQADLKLPEDVELKLSLGYAKIDRFPMDLSQ
ncbi:uncharacterized protein Dana_GF21793 [Drosophila ananassae]|uniref:Uncharacterized protein n=1 Tax=Drosophila ananassae TaxID=7217 RepID=B3N068_DROAN|nr:uncharacterized protein LOC6504464 [Drosophila ananassae]EDV38272.1 uncharacterized protein Dana_GF21793 [Drosophila ananassae]